MTYQDLTDKIEVYEDGRVYSKLTGKFLIPHLRGRKGAEYLKISLYFPDGLKAFNIHRLVAEKYLPNPENKPVINHKDGNKLNNHKDNLEWITHQENSTHAVNMGLISGKQGEENSQSKLTDEVVLYCRSVYKPRDKEFGASALARRFGVSQQTLSKAITGQTWDNIRRNVAQSNEIDGDD